MPMKKNILIWDLPLRVFHWLLVLCVLGAVFCVEVLDDAMQWHGYFGYCILVLVSFRIVWGFIGPVHARFTSFVPTPNRQKKYLQGKTAGGLGHNPLGALSVIGLLVVLAVQAGTGLFADDEIAFQGPLSKYVPNFVVELMSKAHEINHTFIYCLIALHLAAIFFYQKVKGEDLIRPMIFGEKHLDVDEHTQDLPNHLREAAKDGWGHRLLALLLIAGIATLFIYGVVR